MKLHKAGKEKEHNVSLSFVKTECNYDNTFLRYVPAVTETEDTYSNVIRVYNHKYKIKFEIINGI